ncbi:PHD-zinc-finger like domain-containing protein [Lipomyces oligophaga]|uniref:PHD-zinc-finger like domain-containing protein n=1 Tax=Lipomyces oligophaga TaxID=45792 RepID=UPI0034CF8DA8
MSGLITYDERPREERSYLEFHPELAIDMPLRVNFLESRNHSQGHSTRKRKGHGWSKAYNPSTKPTQEKQFRVIGNLENGVGVELDELHAGIGRTYHEHFKMPNSYIRLKKVGMEPEDPNAVEYDMDEQDDQFLIILNEERRRKYNATPISRTLFEIIMTLIEKEWFSLQIQFPKKNHMEAIDLLNETDDSKCAICDDGECENSNAIVFCDGCNLAAHQDCYGVPFIPEGQWLCRQCLAGSNAKVSCIFCPNKGGAFKQTDHGQWAHLLCALWIPETTIGNTVYMEPIEGVERIPRQRWKLSCYICKRKSGACIQCMNKSCYMAYHVTCGRRARLPLLMRSSVSNRALNYELLETFCEKHCSREYYAENDLEHSVPAAQYFYNSLTMNNRSFVDEHERKRASEVPRIRLNLTNLTASVSNNNNGQDSRQNITDEVQQQQHHLQPVIWKTNSGAPVIPHVIYKSICDQLKRYSVRKRKEAVRVMCRYWTLKKEIRRSATLLKRLQVSMETMPARNFTREQEAMRMKFVSNVRKDIGQLLQIAECVVERENLLLEIAKTSKTAGDLVIK